MKNYFVKSLVAVFTLTFISSAHADVDLNVIQQASPNPAFDVFLVQATATAGDLVASFKDLSISGVHNITENAAGGGQSTSLDSIGGTFWNPNWSALDTHLLLDLSGSNLTTSPGFAIGETNDGTNPGGLTATELEGPSPFGSFGGGAGMGSLSFSVNTDQITLLAPRPTTFDLMQVVVPAGGIAFLNVVSESDQLVVDTISQFPVTAIPEPTSLVLAGLGLIGFVGTRRRS